MLKIVQMVADMTLRHAVSSALSLQLRQLWVCEVQKLRELPYRPSYMCPATDLCVLGACTCRKAYPCLLLVVSAAKEPFDDGSEVIGLQLLKDNETDEEDHPWGKPQ